MIENKKIFKNVCLFTLIILIAGISFYSCTKDVSVSPPDAPPPNGYVYVNSYPTGFHIYLDSKARRRVTPDSITWLKTGTYLITLKKDLFTDTSFTVDVVEGEKRSVFIDFSKDLSMLGSIYCTSKPSKAEIFINDSSTGHYTPYTLQNVLPGQYEIRYHLKNFRDDSSIVSVSSGNLSNIKLTLVDTTLWESYSTNNSGIPTNNLSCISVDKENVVWLGTSNQGFIRFDGKSWKQFTQGNSALPSNTVSTIVVDKNNDLKFVGTMRGFVTFDGINMTFYGFMSSGLPDFQVEAIAIDKADNWYIGTHAGVTKTNGYYWATYDTESVPDKFITSLTVDNDNNLWAGMKSSGIARKSPSGSWVTFNQADYQIISNNVTAIAASPLGEVWIGFEKSSVFGSGLSYYSGTTWSNVYTIPTSSRTNNLIIDHLNNKWVATDQGLVKFSSPTSSSTIIFNFDNTGLNISDVTGVAEDSYGNIWIATNGGGLLKYKGNH